MMVRAKLVRMRYKSFTQYVEEDFRITVTIKEDANFKTRSGFQFSLQGRAYARSPQGKLATTRYAQSDKGRFVSLVYDQTLEGKATYAKYNQSTKGKVAHAKYAKTPEGRARDAKYNQTSKGKITDAKCSARRKRDLGYEPINSWFEGCNGHHLDNTHVIYIPERLHKAIRHKQSDESSMRAINNAAFEWLCT